ncbi:MAG: dihydropteroate synthase [Planctomycetes bacterium RBG_16_64_12]|nr:MAG: dihydropteroate synthase [Planctomycetes bacterium RBG_16_64_12]
MVDRWEVRGQTLKIGRLPLLMGILNVTPDSFSDAGRFFDRGAAIEQGLRLAAEGAAAIDVGGESTRPYSAPVDPNEELRRVIPVVTALCEQTSVPVSIDTSKAVVAREAIAAGARIINDVTGLSADPEMVAVAVDSGAGVCVMHMQGSPRTMQEKPTYGDVVEEVLAYLRRRRDALIAAGIAPERIALDPGIGFGKTPEHNLSLLAAAWRLHELGCPVLVGHSRKAFIGVVLDDASADRTAGTIGVALALARQGVEILRVHDVAPVRQALLLYEAAGGLV